MGWQNHGEEGRGEEGRGKVHRSMSSPSNIFGNQAFPQNASFMPHKNVA